jgi:2,4-dienoyl-CoA reductase-like NADH-dependent reductase (Old Yellow Enzyme family)
VGPGFPVLVKLNSEDFLENGINPAEAVQVAALLEQSGVDAVELSGGCRAAGKTRWPARLGRVKSPADEGYYRTAARLYQQEVGLPLILVGGLRSFEVAEELVGNGTTDFISLCRPLIREPGLIKRWREGDRRPAACLSDNLCYGPAFDGRGVYCITEELERAKAR